jgi:putative FmdB family regulatory protein
MPTYEYRCPDGHEFELFQRMSDEPGADCPECGKRAERLLSAGGGLLFKGEGFYITDYRSAEYKKKAKAESGGPSKGAEKSDAGSSSAGSSGASTSGGGTSSPGSGSAAPSSSSD